MPRAESVRRKVLVTQRKTSATVPQVKRMSAKFKKSGLRKKSIVGAGSPEQQQCIICLDTDQVIERDKLLCGHSFHRTCINRWLGTSESCPICRKPVKPPPQAHGTVNLPQQLQLNQFSQPQQRRGASPQPQMPREQRRLLEQQAQSFQVEMLHPQLLHQTQELQLNPSGVRAHQQLFTPQSRITHEQQLNTARVQEQRPLFTQESRRTYEFITNSGEQAQQRPLFPQPSLLLNPSGVQIQRQLPHSPTYQLSSSPRLQHSSMAEQLKLHRDIVDDILQESHERMQEERRLQEENKKLQEENKKSQEENKKLQEEIKKLKKVMQKKEQQFDEEKGKFLDERVQLLEEQNKFNDERVQLLEEQKKFHDEKEKLNRQRLRLREWQRKLEAENLSQLLKGAATSKN